MATLLRRFALTTLAAMALMLVAAPAFAHHADGHTGGGPNATAPAVTEDSDNDGMPNTPDPAGDTDNRHPSGNDKSAESGGSGNQGKAKSTPDQNGTGPERDYEGTDKPDGAGGLDKLDQDGNNGCGNDDDFEDDNEGLCGGKAKPPKPTTPAESSTDSSTGGSSTGGSSTGSSGSSSTSVSPPTAVRDASAWGGSDGPVVPAGVLSGAAAAPAVAVLDGELAFTGLDITSLLLAMAILGLLGGVFLVSSRRKSRA